MPVSEIISLDVGQTRTGLARASTAAKLAEPLFSVATTQLVKRLSEMVNQGDKTIVVGLPRSLSGEETAQTRWVRDFTKFLKTKLPDVKFYWQDEALTSREAADKLQKSRFKNQSFDEHARAAAIILQDFLDTPADNKVAA